ncbi:AEC family transporter [Halocatena pleomorpha]|uniref:AEC family transporter n=1 Tax=Halocatena pleomorpha TaxID=1785090 RepID=A0A3P3RE89_9EURY|nr:AEC family transporter [Halocatena pleomorpha]RRJ31816.1 AEC family transporter [Halocatena pleomorpha]
MPVFERLMALLGLLMVGTGLRVTGVLDDNRAAQLNTLTYYVALPALIFISTYQRSISALLSPALLEGLVLVVVVTVGLAWLIHRNAATQYRSVALVQSYHSNLGYLGLPLVAATFEPRVTAIASVILGVVSLIQVPLTVLILTTMSGTDTRFLNELQRLITNPVLVSLLVGLAVGSTGLAVPSVVASGLDAIGTLALPLALLCVGSSLKVDLSAVDLSATGWVVALKNGCMPALAWGVFSLLTVNPATFTASVVMFGTPTAVSTFVYANELGGDEQFASLNVFITTLISTGTLFVLIRLVS